MVTAVTTTLVTSREAPAGPTTTSARRRADQARQVADVIRRQGGYTRRALAGV